MSRKRSFSIKAGNHLWALAGAAFTFLIPFAKWIGWFGNLDFVVTRIQDPDWIGVLVNACSAVLSYLLNLPPWSYPLMIVAGITLLMFDRRLVYRGDATVPIQSNAIDDESSAQKNPAVAIDATSMFGFVGDAKALSAIRITNIGDVALHACVVKAEGIRAIYKSDASSIVSKPVERIPDPMVLRTEGQWRNERKGGFNLRIGESKNVAILWRNKNDKGPRYLIGEDGTRYPISNSFDVTIAVYGASVPAKKRLGIRIGNSVETTVLPDEQDVPIAG